ncbi:MAG TPA: 4-(cytidine 5'-diphospho)-2-C-methyl-D-erythritol kinase [Rhodothermales bacterium]|nr:4-(cytidine 5'-diphospho)-2-C-methyl-D-erythritol kinase [Rhodothermales bacterium]
MTLTRHTPAKLNLGLHILRRRSDGYHDLQTVFVPIGWMDTLTATPAPDLRFACSDPTLPTDARNLVVRASEALRRYTGTTEGAALHLDKNLPHGAGLGGGSSDAAATLLLLSDLWGLAVPPADLHALSRGLGADVPFFLDPRPALATGIGDVLTPLAGEDGAPYRLPYPLVVAVPPVAVSTAEAYRHVTPHGEGRPDLAAVVCSNDLERWRRELTNDFEAPVVAAYPALAPVREALHDAGAAFVSMSGSGSAFFGVFDDDALALAAAEALRYAGCSVWHGVAEQVA